MTAHPGDDLTSRRRLGYVLILGAQAALGPATMDSYLPALPALQAEFVTGASAIQLTLSATMLGFGFGQLLTGPWSDRVGRRLPLVLATLLHITACLGAALSTNVWTLGAFRLLMGFGAASGAVVTMATARDLFGGKPLVKMLSRLALINGLAPVIAPLVGAQILLFTDWRGIFYALTLYGLVLVTLVALFVRETLSQEHRASAASVGTRQRYAVLFRDRTFLGIVGMGTMTFTGLFAYLSASSFLFQDVYQLSPQQYGLLFATNSVGIIFGVQTSSYLMRRNVGPQWVLAATTTSMVLLAVIIVAFDLLGGGMWGTIIPLNFYIMACGFSFPCVQVLALADHPAEAGTAASVLGASNFGIAGILSPLVGVFGIANAIPMGTMMLVASAISVSLLWFVVKPTTVAPLAD